MILSVHQPQYIPWLGFFDKLARSDAFVFLDTVQYKPQEWQNRNKIRTKDGSMWLTVPVVTAGLGRQRICDVRIDNSSSWQQDHWTSMRCWYARAPYFSAYAPFWEDVFAQKWEKLMDFNIAITKFLLEKLAITIPLYMESDLGTTAQATDRIIQLCQGLKADGYLTGIGGKNYLEEEKFPQAGIRLQYQDYHHPAYRQQYLKTPEDFLAGMSVVDLLFNEGEHSAAIIRKGGNDHV